MNAFESSGLHDLIEHQHLEVWVVAAEQAWQFSIIVYDVLKVGEFSQALNQVNIRFSLGELFQLLIQGTKALMTDRG